MVHLSGDQVETDTTGSAVFSKFRVERGPEAFYTFQYSVVVNEDTTIVSETFSSFMRSEIYSLESLNTFPLSMEFEFGRALPVQPEVKLMDSKGEPIKGRRIIAFSWIDPSFIKASIYYKQSPSHYKFITFENYVSEPSDDNGIARFTSLTITGSNDILAYLHFYAEGVAIAWTNRPSGNEYEDFFPTRAIYPIFRNHEGISIEIKNDHSRINKEGDVLDVPYSLIVTNSTTLDPIPGLI